ncbi:MAG: MogA/MoaB family molybdenum cofactor biosynthesis protein [Dehalococcoidia bacterium]|nr:MogA/MoaB family molybdenum cofactor biosynthesis protein [Dehalococcoidia bacterium]
MFTAGVLTVSDKGSRGERIDESGKVIKEALVSLGAAEIKYGIVPDERQAISAKLREWSDAGLDLVLTTGGTGLTPRDVTPEATLDVLDRIAPGFAEAMRAHGMKQTPTAMLSRAVSGVRKKTLIINMPGSPKAVKECLEAISPALPHAIETVRGQASECARR